MAATEAGDSVGSESRKMIKTKLPLQSTSGRPYMSPCEYERESTMTTDDRHAIYSNRDQLGAFYSEHKDEYGPFQVSPYRVVFQGFQSCEIVEQTIRIKNNDVVPRLLMIAAPKSQYFSVTNISSKEGKLAPGMFATYRITFKPEHICDYHVDLQCRSDNSVFSIPVEAIGCRPVLQFPDEITFHSHPIRSLTTRSIIARNVGQKKAFFNITADPPFSVEPQSSVVEVGGDIHFTFSYFPETLGDHRCFAVLKYDDGPQVGLLLLGKSHQLDVSLSSQTVRPPSTFIALKSTIRVKLQNNSEWPVSFTWHRYRSQEEYNQLQQTHEDTNVPPDKLKKSSDHRVTINLDALEDIEALNPYIRPMTPPMCDPVFHHDAFSLFPLTGDIWPHSFAEITVCFEPHSEGTIEVGAFCEVSGRASRLCLNLVGEGKGPDIVLGFSDFNIGEVFKNAVFEYPIPVTNHGDIDGYLTTPVLGGDLGQLISFIPKCLRVSKHGSSTLTLKLNACRVGPLSEQFDLHVSNNRKPITFKFRGRVLLPTMRCDLDHLEFGTVPFGFECQRKCTLHNTSDVDINFCLSMAKDGSEPVIRQEDMTGANFQIEKLQLPNNPAEFSLTPDRGVVFPHSSVTIVVTLISNSVGPYCRWLVVRADDSPDVLLSITVTVECIVATVQTQLIGLHQETDQSISLTSSDSNLSDAAQESITSAIDQSAESIPDNQLRNERIRVIHYKNFPTESLLSLVNISPIATRFYIVSQTKEDGNQLEFQCLSPTNIIEPKSSIIVPFSITTRVLGKLSLLVKVVILGSCDPLLVYLSVVSQGPYVSIDPPLLDWGTIAVLDSQSKSITVKNNGPVPATIKNTLDNDRCWQISPNETVVESGSEQEITVTALLTDPILYKNLLSIQVEDGKTWEIPLEAKGKGSSIQVEPAFGTILNLGPIFRSSVRSDCFLATNRGSRLHHITWSCVGVIPNLESFSELSNRVNKSSKLGRRPVGFQPVFSLSPSRLDLKPKESKYITIEALSHEIGERREEVTCTAVMGTSTSKVTLYRFVATAQFIDPSVDISHDSLSLLIHRVVSPQSCGHVATCHCAKDVIFITNESPLPLTATISTEEPFSLNTDGRLKYYSEARVSLEAGDRVEVHVKFTVSFDELVGKDFSESLLIRYDEHFQQDEVRLSGTVVLPNITLSENSIDFGDINCPVEATHTITVSNTGELPADFEWRLLSDKTEIQWLVPRKSTRVTRSSAVAAESDRTRSSHGKREYSTSTKESSLVKEGCIVVGEDDCTFATFSQRVLEVYERAKRECHQVEFAAVVDSVRQQLDDFFRKRCSVNEIIKIEPSKAHLSPNCKMSTTVHFCCPLPVKLRTTAACLVENSSHRLMPISVTASNVSYSLSSRRIDLGHKLYCQALKATLTLTNTGDVEFTWSLETSHEHQSQLSVAPCQGSLAPSKNQRISITYQPEAPESFTTDLKITVAYHKPETVVVSGTSVYPSIILNTTLNYSGVSEMIFLQAVQNLSSQLDTVIQSQLPTFQNKTQNIQKSIAEPVVSNDAESSSLEDTQTELNTPSISELSPRSEESDTLDTSWSLIDTNVDHVVNPMLINAEVERILLVNHLREIRAAAPPSGANSNFISFSPQSLNAFHYIIVTGSSTARNPNFKNGVAEVFRPRLDLSVLHTVLNFGQVCVGELYRKTIYLVNVSPITAAIRVNHNSQRSEQDLLINLDGQDGLGAGQIANLSLTFRPAPFDGPIQRVEYQFSIDVRYGLSIPIIMQAVNTQPLIKFNPGKLKFGRVHVGSCHMSQIKFLNCGVIPVNWKVSVSATERSGQDSNQLSPVKSPQNHVSTKVASAFEVRPRTGTLAPNHWAVLNVQFSASQCRKYRAIAVLEVTGSKFRVFKRMSAEGVELMLRFSAVKIEFDRIIPYTGGTSRKLVITNPNDVPIELYSLEFDRQYLLEEHQLRMCRLISGKNMLVLPTRTPGQTFWSELSSFHDELLKHAAVPIQDTAVSIPDTATPVPDTATAVPDTAESASATVQKDAPQVKSSWSGWDKHSSHRNNKHQAATLLDIEKFLAEYVEFCKSTAASNIGLLPADPVKHAMRHSISQHQTAEHRTSLLRRAPVFVVIGGPHTEPKVAASFIAEQYGDLLKLSMDQAVMDVLKTDRTINSRVREVLFKSTINNNKVSIAPGKHAGKKSFHQQPASVSNYAQSPVPTTEQLPPEPVPDLEKAKPLPSSLLTDIFFSRLLHDDTRYGVVFTELTSFHFSDSVATTLECLLTAVGTRPCVRVLTLYRSYQQYTDDESLHQHHTNGQSEPSESAEKMVDPEIVHCDEIRYEELTPQQQLMADRLLKEERKAQQLLKQQQLQQQQQLLQQQKLEAESRKLKSRFGAGTTRETVHHTSPAGSSSRKSIKFTKAPTQLVSAISTTESPIEDRQTDDEPKSASIATIDVTNKIIEDQFNAYEETVRAITKLMDSLNTRYIEGLQYGELPSPGDKPTKQSWTSQATPPTVPDSLPISSAPLTAQSAETFSPSALVQHLLITGNQSATSSILYLLGCGALPDKHSIDLQLGLGGEGPTLDDPCVFSAVYVPQYRTISKHRINNFYFEKDESQHFTAKLQQSEVNSEIHSDVHTPTASTIPRSEYMEKSPSKKHHSKHSVTRARRKPPSSDATSEPPHRTVFNQIAESHQKALKTAFLKALGDNQISRSDHRWIIEPHQQVELTCCFQADSVGQYVDHLTFETLTGQLSRRYLIGCHGNCSMPDIDRDRQTIYSKVFCMESRIEPCYGRAYISSSDTLSFGALPATAQLSTQLAKTSSSTSNIAQPSRRSSAEIVIKNGGLLPIFVMLVVQESGKTPPAFSVSPSSLEVGVGSRRSISVSASAPGTQEYSAILIACVRDNPSPWTVQLKCYGVRPEVHVEPKTLQFDRVILRKRRVIKIHLQNKSPIPLSYRIIGEEYLDGMFKLTPNKGVLNASEKASIQVAFRPTRPSIYTNKKLRLEISDDITEVPVTVSATESGVAGRAVPPPATGPSAAHSASVWASTSVGDSASIGTSLAPPPPSVSLTDIITVSGEGFGDSVELTLPQNNEVLKFGLVKLKDVAKLTINMKNEGKHAVMFKMYIESIERLKSGASLSSCFTITPEEGLLTTANRSVSVQISAYFTDEVHLEGRDLLRLLIIDHSRGRPGEQLSLRSIPVSILAAACRHVLAPPKEINFGHIPIGIRKNAELCIKNTSVFEVSYQIIRQNVTVTTPPGRSTSKMVGTKSFMLDRRASNRNASRSVSTLAPQAHKLNPVDAKRRLIAGSFQIYPFSGQIAALSETHISVEVLASEAGEEIQDLLVHLTDGGSGSYLPYQLLASAVPASIKHEDGSFVSIFQRHTVVPSIEQFFANRKNKLTPSGGVYGVAENRFVLDPIVTGDVVSVTFLVPNTSAVAVDIVTAVRVTGDAGMQRKVNAVGVCKVTPARCTIPPRSTTEVQLTFTPKSTKIYQCILEIQLEEAIKTDRSKNIIFEVVCESTLPHVDVLEPLDNTKKLSPVLNYLSVALDQTACKPLVLANTGKVEATVEVRVKQGGDILTVNPDKETACLMVFPTEDSENTKSDLIGWLKLPPGDEARFDVHFRPISVGINSGQIDLRINHAIHSVINVSVTGYGFDGGVFIEGLSVSQYTASSNIQTIGSKVKLDESLPTSIRRDMAQVTYTLKMIDCFVGPVYQERICMNNASSSEIYRFEWSSVEYLEFSPRAGHLLPGEKKAVAITFHAQQPVEVGNSAHCKIHEISLPNKAVSLFSQQESISWDSRQMTANTHTIAKSRAMQDRDCVSADLRPVEEPVHTVLHPNVQVLETAVSLRADYPRVKLSTSHLQMPAASILQAIRETITVQNVGVNDVHFCWKLEEDASLSQSSDTAARNVTSPEELERAAVLLSLAPAEPPVETSSGGDQETVTGGPASAFSVRPFNGVIAAGQSSVVTVAFCARDLEEHVARLHCQIMYMAEEASPLRLTVRGRASLPIYHLAVEPHRQLDSAVTNLSPLEGANLLVTIPVTGVVVPAIRNMYIINCGQSQWQYNLTMSPSGKSLDTSTTSQFRSTMPTGVVYPGDRCMVTFEYSPTIRVNYNSTPGGSTIATAKCNFSIPEHSVRHTIQLVAVKHT